MVKIAEAVGGVLVMGAVHVQLGDPVEHILAELHIPGGGPATLVFVCRDVGPEGLEV